MQHAARQEGGGPEKDVCMREEVRTQALYQTYGSLQTVYTFLGQETQPDPAGEWAAAMLSWWGWGRGSWGGDVEGDRVGLLQAGKVGDPAILTGFAGSPSGVHRENFLLFPSQGGGHGSHRISL